MTVTPQEAADHGAAEADYFDVLIVGAGISGIDAATGSPSAIRS